MGEQGQGAFPLSVHGTPTAAALSLVVVLHDCAKQADNALLSLSPGYQRDVSEPYEIVVVEAPSDDVLGETRARRHGEHVRYFQVPSAASWRLRCIEQGLSEARGAIVGLFQDAAHIVTPRVIEQALVAFRAFERPLVVVPDYVLDPTRVAARGNARAELDWFAGCGWQRAPYSLFEHASYGPACLNGPLSPLLGASVLFFRKHDLGATPALPAELDLPGTGALRLRLFTELCRLAGTKLVILSGEGAFRQTHPEVAGESVRWQEQSAERVMVNAVLPQGHEFRGVHREPISFGDIPREAEPHVSRSAALAEFHCIVCRNKGEPAWYEDPA